MDPQKPKIGFFSLPPRVRFRIYECVLVCKQQVPASCRPLADPPLASILRTCKRVHSEAFPILYSNNTFLLSEPETILLWFEEIGRVNIKHLRSIRIFVDAPYYTKEIPHFVTKNDGLPWYELLDRLAREATGLRHLYIYWDLAEDCGHFGAGKDVRFVRELAKIRGLQSMEIDGFYAMRWPRYLSEKMGLSVHEGGGDSYYMQRRRKYQRGTENLVP